MKKFIYMLIPFMVFTFQQPTSAEKNEPKELKAAIIIDDFGGGTGGVRDFLEGEIPITAAVMPFSEHSTEHAEWAHKYGIEVMIHLSMEPKRGKRSWLGPRPITNDLSPAEVRQIVEDAIKDVPYAVGINNHMGSLAVENKEIVRAIVEVAKERRLFIIDSATSPNTKFPEIAKELGVPILKRDVFLDDISSSAHVRKQMIRLAKVTEIKGTGIAIGHVGITGKICSIGVFQAIDEFNKRNIKIVPVSKLFSGKLPEKYFIPYKKGS
ncbi:divergent polysaccharide deacetylase family protein [Bacillus sp. ISL-40]|uniref:divergent polysaccharide deacetylase family protein n=1 Tax=unclassified Bacillus (in: firmicutes) TaxID=185979 RepID=UPI001BE9FB91|nr:MULTISPECIES: divergent polysaccharide deacetylase family protein [unclassified Bacillus (in: firmicutes)]MBT2699701.1 divergent polysaccharide deacetylase family protein [Bacillus sp. ISL-40]MBT2723610.1 divergent polysaccharide deacetylase family protein [Bacillus sp. ISL-46]MBT2744321.1 divergent polysaccharide deacetylase family protein [Bacillus sp. ISL-77]